MRVRAVVVFRGRVQGVYFRAHCADKAEELGLDGYVRNMLDGSVEAVEVNWSEPRGDVRGFQVHR